MKKKYIEYHRDGSVHAQGYMKDGVPDGYWEWFRLNGTIMRSGNFQEGDQVGEWVTYDKKGHIFKVTKFVKKTKSK